MGDVELFGWERLRHGGLLLDAERLRQVAAYTPPPLSEYHERELRRRASAIIDGNKEGVGPFVAFVLETICGFTQEYGLWQRGSNVSAQWSRVVVGGETIKPRHLWRGLRGGLLPVFFDDEKRLGMGRGRKVLSQVLQWLRAGGNRLALVTNGRQWRLVFAGLDYDAWCEWDLDLWFEEGELSPQVTALRTLFTPALWLPPSKDAPMPLVQAILDSRKGQADLSATLGERVREAVELLVQSHGEVLLEQCRDVDPAEIYRAAVRVIMRLVVVLFAEARELLPRDNAIYHGSYGLTGLMAELEKTATTRGISRLARSWNAWPRILALFRLIYEGSYHKDIEVPEYGGELFAPGNAEPSADGLNRALAVFESACFDHELMSDREVYRILDRITRTRVRLRQGRSSIMVSAPVDFSDLSSEYIGILYEGLLDFELRTAPAGDPIIFLAVGNQPALPLSRLEAMDDKALANLLEKMKDTSTKEEEAEEGDEIEDTAEEADSEVAAASEAVEAEESDDATGESEPEQEEEETGDEHHNTRTRAEEWACRAVMIGKLVPKPRGTITPEKRLAYQESIARKARQLVARVILPGEWYLVRWGGTRKGSGTFYTPPGLAVPTVHRTLRPLAWNPPMGENGEPNRDAPPAEWTPKKPGEILSLKVCDPACGSGSFLIASLRFLTDSLYASLHYHGRIPKPGEPVAVRLLTADETGNREERLSDDLLPCPPDDPLFEQRLKAVLRRYVVERCIYGVDLDPLAVELCRLALWIETMDRLLPFTFLDHKIKCGNSLVGAWFDQFQHYPVMAWKNREGGDSNHNNGVHFKKNARTQAIKSFVSDRLTPDLRQYLEGRTLFRDEDPQEKALAVHAEALAILSHVHEMPVRDSADRARIYREELLGSEAYRSLKEAMDLWCACWFWPAEELEHAPLPSALSEPSKATKAIAARIAAKHRFFHWELEFPDVFCAARSGFDAMLGNPPWDIAKPNSKEFFSNIDPLYRTYGKQEALRYQSDYFSDKAIELSWLDYNADLKAQSNYFKYSVSAYGDPETAEKSADKFPLGRGADNERLHKGWRAAREKSRGFADPRHPFRYQGSADINLFKLFLEQVHALLRPSGRLGFIVPSGLYSDYGTGGLRSLFLNQCNWEWLFGFENRDGIFDIHRSYKFNPVIVEKGGSTGFIRTAFMRRKLEEWEQAETIIVPYTHAQVKQLSPSFLTILEIHSTRELEILSCIQTDSKPLKDFVTFTQQFDMTGDSSIFPPVSTWTKNGFQPDQYGIWIGPNKEKALPVYEGRMIGQFDPSQKRWISGKGRSALWEDVGWASKIPGPQFLIDENIYKRSDKCIGDFAFYYMKISSSTNMRTLIGTVLYDMPSVYSLCQLVSSSFNLANWLALSSVLNSFIYDFIIRLRLGGLNVTGYILEETPIPASIINGNFYLDIYTSALSFANDNFAYAWVIMDHTYKLSARNLAWKRLWAVTPHERLRIRCIIDAIIGNYYGIKENDFYWILRDCDHPKSLINTIGFTRNLNPKGFWRVDKEQDPELRHTVLTLVAFHDLQQRIAEYGGDKKKGIEAFCQQNGGEGWMLPETLCLADYGLGHDDRAKVPQPVASRFGPRFYDWQLAQSPEESWRECHLHARNLLGEEGYQRLVRELNAGRDGEKRGRTIDTSPVTNDGVRQGKLF